MEETEDKPYTSERECEIVTLAKEKGHTVLQDR
jgi:hypothetical protein